MSVAFVDQTEVENVSGTSIDVGVPADAAAGDVAYVILGIGSGTVTVTPPGDWDQLSEGDEFPYISVCRKVLAGGDPGATVTFDIDTSVTVCAAMIVFSGADQTTPEDATATNYALGGQGASIPCPSVDTTKDNDVVLIYGVSGDDVTFGPTPAGWTAGPVVDKVATYYITQASPGASGTVDITQSGASSFYGSGTIAIAPAGGAPAALEGSAGSETTAEGTLVAPVGASLAGESATETEASGVLEVINPSLQGEAETETSAEGTLTVTGPPAAPLHGTAETESSAEGTLTAPVATNAVLISAGFFAAMS